MRCVSTKPQGWSRLLAFDHADAGAFSSGTSENLLSVKLLGCHDFQLLLVPDWDPANLTSRQAGERGCVPVRSWEAQAAPTLQRVTPPPLASLGATLLP